MSKQPLLFILLVMVAACTPATARPSPRQIVAVPLATVLAGRSEELEVEAVIPDTNLIDELFNEGAWREDLLRPERLVAPVIGLDIAVSATDWTPGGEWNVPNSTAGWLESSGAFGETGNTVLAGHHNSRGEVFRNLSKLIPGDLLTLYAADQARTYSVRERLILPVRDLTPEQQLQYASFINRTTDERLTLVTCWPYVTNSHRVIVIAMPLES